VYPTAAVTRTRTARIAPRAFAPPIRGDRGGAISILFRAAPCRAHRHSFPTRRSSDLSLKIAGCSFSWWRLALGHSLKALAALELDRKSTRLNSSHLGISYAVFCLKKKVQAVDGARGGIHQVSRAVAARALEHVEEALH